GCVVLCCSTCICNDPAPADIVTLSLHDALPILPLGILSRKPVPETQERTLSELRVEALRISTAAESAGGLARNLKQQAEELAAADRKSTRLNSSHVKISYAVFCLKKKTSVTARQ